MKIYLIRHGQTTGDVEGRYGGSYDDELSDQGVIQANKLADKLNNSNIEILFCSPLIRAQQTAKILKSKLNCEIKTIQDLQERNKNGILTGMTKKEAELKYPDLAQKVKDYRNQITGAESQEDFIKRIKKAFLEVINNTDYSTIAIVTHGGPIWAVFRDIMNNEGVIDIGDCGYMVLNKENQKLTIEKMNDIFLKKN